MLNNTSTYLGVKVSDTTATYFSNATAHFANATVAAANCGMYATATAVYGAKTAMQGLIGLCAYKEFAGEVMTGHAFGFAMPKIVSVLVSGVAGAIYHHPTAVMATFVGAAVLASPHNAMECAKNAAYTGVEAANFVYENAAGIINGAAGVGHLIYDNLPSHSEAPQMDLAGSMTVSWVDAIAG